jgi:5,10-methylene-tetrahydrofolate dehydrogenase/methenyl tetrahydrofolate cyclohydrolase
VLSAISLEKDVDGFHPLNVGRLAMKGREPLFVPCTPKARRRRRCPVAAPLRRCCARALLRAGAAALRVVPSGWLALPCRQRCAARAQRTPATNPSFRTRTRMCFFTFPLLHTPAAAQGCIELLDRSGVPIAGAHAVVVGRSNIVGLPAALLLQARDATVTVVHSGTRDVASYVRRADILIAAAGKAGMVKAEWLKPGAVVIDVGTNSVADATKKTGYRLVGDVDFEGALRVASKVTPVPGGVGPMTIAMLLQNCLIAAQRSVGEEGEAAKAT